MKILFLNNYYYVRGGSERVLFEEMRILKDAGHRVAIFTRNDSHNEQSDYQEFFPPAIDTGHPGVSLDAVKTAVDIIYSRSSRNGLKHVIEKFRPDIVHAHNIYGRLSLSVLDELQHAEIPVVLTLHDLKLLCPSYLMLNHGKICEKCKGGKYCNAIFTRCHKNSYLASAIYAFESWFNAILKKYDTVRYFICPSRFLMNKCIEYGWKPEKFVHIPNFVGRRDAGKACQTQPYVLYFGRLSPEKGVRTLLEAFGSMKSGYDLVIAGDGPERQELEGIAADNPKVRFAGYLTGKELDETVAGAKAVVIPSECYENAPLSILESLAFGKPVIGSRIGGITEMIEDRINGLLFEPGSSNDLRDKLELMLGMPETGFVKMKETAQDLAEKQYSAGVHLRRLLDVYTRAMQRD